MQILGLYYPGNPRRFLLKALREFHNAQLFFPIVFELGREPYSSSDHTRIGIFPTFYSIDRRATIPQVLAQSFRKDQNYHMTAKADNIRSLSIYLVDFSDLLSVYDFAKEMVVSFPGICNLILRFKRCDIVSFLLTIDDYNRTDLIRISIILASQGN